MNTAKRMRVREPLALAVLRLLLGAVFLWAALSKLLWLHEVSYGQTFVGSILSGRRELMVAASVVEGSAALGLLFRVGVGTACVLLCSGLVAVGLMYLHQGDHTQACGCMGPEGTERLLPLSVPVRIGLITLALVTLGIQNRFWRIAALARGGEFPT